MSLSFHIGLSRLLRAFRSYVGSYIISVNFRIGDVFALKLFIARCLSTCHVKTKQTRLLVLRIADDVTAVQPGKYETYCETETFNATCDAPGDVILVTHALYGRMRLSRCTKIDYGHIGCSSDVTELADSRCSGRQACEIAIPDALFAKSQPCPEDLKPYLEVGYTCLTGKPCPIHLKRLIAIPQL